MLRKFTKTDYRSLSVFREKISKESEYLGAMSDTRAKDVLNFKPTETGYGIFEGSDLVGELLLTAYEKYLKIDSIGILSCVRGKGYAKLLLKTAEREALSRDLKQIRLVVRFDNKPAIFLYESTGYIKTGMAETNLTYLKNIGVEVEHKSTFKKW